MAGTELGSAEPPVEMAVPTESRLAQQHAAPSSAPAPYSAAELQTRLERRLHAALRGHFAYPALAKKRGWEGLVKVGVRVLADGQLHDVHVLASSGHRVLDRAALRSVLAIQRLDQQGDPWPPTRHFDIVLPIKYHLVDG